MSVRRQDIRIGSVGHCPVEHVLRVLETGEIGIGWRLKAVEYPPLVGQSYRRHVYDGQISGVKYHGVALQQSRSIVGDSAIPAPGALPEALLRKVVPVVEERSPQEDEFGMVSRRQAAGVCWRRDGGEKWNARRRRKWRRRCGVLEVNVSGGRCFFRNARRRVECLPAGLLKDT